VSDWPTVRLGDVTGLLAGYPFPSAKFTDNPTDPRLLRGDNVGQGALRWEGAKRWPARKTDGLDDYWLRRDDVILAMDRPWIEAGLKFAAVRDGDLPSLLVQRVSRIRGTSRLDSRFLKHVIASRSFTHYILSVQTGTTVPHISATQILDFKFRLPPIEEQRRIAAILGAFDDKIELNRRTTQTLEATARALFGRWFLSAETSGEWPIEPLAAHLEVIRGLSYKGDGLASTGVPLHNLNSVYEGGGYKPDGIKWYSGPYAERHTVEPGDVIVTNTEQGHDRMLIGHAALVPGSFGRLGLFSHHLYRVRPRPGSVLSRSFVAYLLNSRAIHDLVSGYSNGTTVQMLPVEALQQPAIRIPPASLIRRFDALATISHQRQEIARGEAQALAMLRDALLPRLLSGPIRETA